MASTRVLKLLSGERDVQNNSYICDLVSSIALVGFSFTTE